MAIQMLAGYEPSVFIQKLVIALAVGGLIGLEREWKKRAAGLRTMILMAAGGMISSFLASKLGLPYAIVIFMAFACVIAVAIYAFKAWRYKGAGLTTSVALVISFILGVLVERGFVLEAVMATILITFILAAKELLHGIVRGLSGQEIMDALKFGIVTFIVLPVLPNTDYKLFNFILFNPFKTWLFAVFVLGISFIAYIAMRSVGIAKGVSVTGLLGGLVSSTAVTTSMSSRARENPKLTDSCVTATVLASAVMFVRLLVIAMILSPDTGKLLILPFIGTALVGFALSLRRMIKLQKKNSFGKKMSVGSPFAFKPALQFAVIFAAIIALSAIANQYLGQFGIYLASIFGGFADLDAITISSASLATATPLPLISFSLAATSILIAGAVNTLVKLGITKFGGTKEMFNNVLKYFAIMLVTLCILGYLSIMRFGF